MDNHDRHAIEALFQKLAQVERTIGTAPRDPEAEALIRERMTRQPGSGYYMAQTILVQEQALTAAQERIEVLERELANRPTGGGFLASLFGGGSSQPTAPAPVSHTLHASSFPSAGVPAQNGAIPHGGLRSVPTVPGGVVPAQGGFLGGAAQTAMGVAGGMVLGGLIGSAFAGGGAGGEPAAAAQPASAEAPAQDDFAGELDSEAA